jgi:hypothetical protein
MVVNRPKPDSRFDAIPDQKSLRSKELAAPRSRAILRAERAVSASRETRHFVNDLAVLVAADAC